MATVLGLDIGSNSVGSAWIDTDKKIIKLGCSVFPSGVEESETKRGAPKNQARRSFRQRRRNIKRRSDRKRKIKQFLMKIGWMPSEEQDLSKWLSLNPWLLRKEGLKRELFPQEFGRIILHLAQRRGAFGFDYDDEVSDVKQEQRDENDNQEEKKNIEKDKEQKIKGAIERTKEEMKRIGAVTFGQFMAIKYLEREYKIEKKRADGNIIHSYIHFPIRNRNSATGDGIYEYCPDRSMIWQEFDLLWKKQQTFQGELSKQLTNSLRKELDDPTSDATWRYKGLLFSQRKTYWDLGTLGRCALEPTDMRCPKADMYAQEFLVLETVNNIRIITPNEPSRKLDDKERAQVLKTLRSQKNATEATIRKALKIHTPEKKRFYSLSLDKDTEKDLNTDWFYREIILGAIGEMEWGKLSQKQKDSINKAILKHNPKEEKDKNKLIAGCSQWWGFNDIQTKSFIMAWLKRPNIEKRINYSRRAILNLLPYMRKGWTVNEARKLFSEDATNGATDEQRRRYGFKESIANRATRQYMEKHPDLLPPAPQELSNPVVRKSIHEVRRHIIAHMRRFGCKPDRIIVELAREARQTAKVRNKKLSQNRRREKIKKAIILQYQLDQLREDQQNKAVDRVLLCREQKGVCPYSNLDLDSVAQIDEANAAKGIGVEVDHIIPRSRGGDNSLNNLVLCFDGTNRGKGNKTPQEWLTKEQFAKLEQRLGHLKKENPTKWENLHKKVEDLEGFVKSQLTDTAYASRQVANWLKDVLYDGERDGTRHVFTTKGVYTSILRKDWRLFLNGSDDQAQEKDRSDHRHHALDAVAIAFCGPERIRQVAKVAEEREQVKAEGKELGKREPFDPPWGNHESFRQQVMKEIDKLVVAHRPESRKITGALHNDTQYGPVFDPEGNEVSHCTIKKILGQLTPNHLRVPMGWEPLRLRYEAAPETALKKRIRKEMLCLQDVPPGKSGIIRDRWFREELRAFLREKGIDPDNFNKKQIQDMIKQTGVTLKSGVPIRRVTLLRTPTVVPIPRKRWNNNTGRMEYYPETEKNTLRLYEPQNNHHIEIRENSKGKWIGEVITNFEAAKRVRPPKSCGQVPQSAVNRNNTEKGKFIMSLSIGEMVYMTHPETKKADYFVVFKIDGTGTIHFTPHWDAGRSRATENFPAREDISLPPNDFSKLGVPPNQKPQKVYVNPLGIVNFLLRD